MQNACPLSRHVLRSLLALSALGSVAATVLALLVSWSAGLGCYALAITLCLAAVLHAAAAPSLVPARS